jgi:hypothetical protein
VTVPDDIELFAAAHADDREERAAVHRLHGIW